MNWIALPRWFILAALSIAATAAEAAECPDVARAGGERYLVVISDLHFGVGHTKDGKWDATEDFRWSGALQGFLQRISSCGKQAVDLVIAGDALELWQPPPDLRCTGTDKDAQCSTKQLVALTQHVVKAHAADLAMLGAFADTGSNKVFFIPGNHDAALLLPDAWAALSRAAGSQTGRVVRSNDGIWISPDGRVAVEHGHQIGQDVNSYAKWPTITREVGGVAHVESPWGERFVQQLFNEQEAAYPIIDNLSPETAGARYRMADRGIWRTSADMARFIRFNLFETSLAQKVDSLGPSDGKAEPPAWDLPYARKMGHQLFLNALAETDPFAAEIKGNSADAAKLRAALDAMASDPGALPDSEVYVLCDQGAIRTAGKVLCRQGALGGLAESLLRSRQSVMADHIKKRMKEPGLGNMRLFVYGHTHQFETEWTVPAPLWKVSIFNTGAFQRLVDEPGFLKRAEARQLTPAQALSKLSVNDLAPCYSAVVIAVGGQNPSGETVRWRQEEGGAPGSFVSPGNTLCN